MRPSARGAGASGAVRSSLLLSALAAAWVLTCFGGLVDSLPAPLGRWGFPIRAQLFQWYREQPLLWLTAQFGLGLALPLALFLVSGRRPADLGLRRIDRTGWRLAAAGATAGAALGAAFAFVSPVLPDGAGQWLRWLCRQLALVPQHALVFGVLMALWSPDRRLRPAPAIRGAGWSRPAAAGALISAVVFLLGHVGKGDPLELLIVFPAGAALAWVTWRSGSIWPALAPHWATNVLLVLTSWWLLA